MDGWIITSECFKISSFFTKKIAGDNAVMWSLVSSGFFVVVMLELQVRVSHYVFDL